jgi:hypothetical protein
MTKEEFASAITKILRENDIHVNDAMHVLIAHAVTIALVGRPFGEAGMRLHEFVDEILEDAAHLVTGEDDL